MAGKHTPGPWGIAPADEWRTASGQHAQFGEFRIDAGSYRVATVSNANNAAQNKANAALIAAAPDLLEALKTVREWAEGESVNYTGDHPIAKARAAIANAERALRVPGRLTFENDATVMHAAILCARQDDAQGCMEAVQMLIARYLSNYADSIAAKAGEAL